MWYDTLYLHNRKYFYSRPSKCFASYGGTAQWCANPRELGNNIPSTFIPTLSRFHSQVEFLFPLPSDFHGIPTFPGNPVPTVVSGGWQTVRQRLYSGFSSGTGQKPRDTAGRRARTQRCLEHGTRDAGGMAINAEDRRRCCCCCCWCWRAGATPGLRRSHSSDPLRPWTAYLPSPGHLPFPTE